MKRTLLTVAILVVLGALAVWLDPTRVLIGALRGESFFAGRPTSYWKHALEGDPAVQADALQRFEQGGAGATSVLIELLRDSHGSSTEVRCTAIEILVQLGADAAAAGPNLLAAVKDPDPYVRSVAAASLAPVQVPAADAVPVLIEMLQGGQKLAAARALSEYRGEAAAALDVLIAVMQDKTLDSETRWNAARTLGKLGAEGADAVPALVEALGDETTTVREHAAEALGDIGPPAAAAVEDLVGVLDDPAVRVRRDAVRSLGQIGPAARVGVAEMKKRLDDPEPIVRDAARNALRAIAPEELPPAKKKP